jgi:hypothetical protein
MSPQFPLRAVQTVSTCMRRIWVGSSDRPTTVKIGKRCTNSKVVVATEFLSWPITIITFCWLTESISSELVSLPPRHNSGLC